MPTTHFGEERNDFTTNTNKTKETSNLCLENCGCLNEYDLKSEYEIQSIN